MDQPLLSICIATYRRGAFIGETLESIIGQLDDRVELLVVDGASPDDTEQVVGRFVERHPAVRYYREATNSGVDADYDKAVQYARGRYCWLMTDDDLLKSDAVARVLAVLDRRPALVVLNAEVRTIDLERVLQPRLLVQAQDREYPAREPGAIFTELAEHLKFIGAVVIDRELWLSRDRASYYGTLFVHVGVIFQAPLPAPVRVLAEPVLKLRYGNAMWTPRGFEIWMFLWPRLVWSFEGFNDAEKELVCLREPWRRAKKLGVQRALGGFSRADYRRYFAAVPSGAGKLAAWCISGMPPRLANAIAGLACLGMPKRSRLNLYDLSRNPNASLTSRVIARWLGV